MRLLAILALAAACMSAAPEPRWPVVLPMTMEKNLPLVQITINGTNALTFILDSAAAGCVIDGESASALGLVQTGTGLSSGSGGTQAVGLLRAVRLNLGGLEIRPPRAYTFDMKALRFHGRVDGILGIPLFGHYVVEIDYPASQVRIFESKSYRVSSNATVLPLRMTVGPVVRGSIRVRGKEPIDTDMQLDTGSAHILTFCTPFVDRYQLLESADELTQGETLGFGGPTPDMVGRIEQVRVGRFVAEKPLVRFARQMTGAFASEQHFSANLGGEFLKRYRVTFDIPNLRLIIE